MRRGDEREGKEETIKRKTREDESKGFEIQEDKEKDNVTKREIDERMVGMIWGSEGMKGRGDRYKNVMTPYKVVKRRDVWYDFGVKVMIYAFAREILRVYKMTNTLKRRRCKYIWW